MKRNIINLNKIVQIIIITVILFTSQKAFALHGVSDGHGGYIMVSDIGGGPTNDSGGGGGDGGTNPTNQGGPDTSTEKAEQERAKKEGELNDAKKSSEDAKNEIAENNDKVSAGDDDKNTDGTYSNFTYYLAQKEAAAAAKLNADKTTEPSKQKNKESLNSENSDVKGDPVRITEGVYEQDEVDLMFGNITQEGLRRKYRSDRKIISSFGYGWSTNLDQRIIRGLEKGSVEYENSLKSSIEYIKNEIKSFEDNLKAYYAVSSLDNIKGEINDRIKKCEANIDSTTMLSLYLYNLYKQSSGFKVEAEIVSLMYEVAVLQNDIKSKKELLESRLETVDSRISELNKMRSLYENKCIELENYKNISKKIEEVKNKNSYVRFVGMENWYEETGFNTITVIDDAGFPHLLFQESDNSEKWSNSEDKRVLFCKKTVSVNSSLVNKFY